MLGAFLATLGIFLRAFIFTAASGPLVLQIRRSLIAGSVLDGSNAGSVSLMNAVNYKLVRAALVDFQTFLLAGLCTVILFCFRVNLVWVILSGAVAGLVLHQFAWR